MEFLNVKKIHFVGIGGIGVSAIARFFVDRGAKVSGSDRAGFDQAEDLRKRGIKVFVIHDAKNLSKDVEAVVYSSAVPLDNPELLFAREHGIPCFEYAEALGEIMRGKYGIGVSGTNGKTTTTAMLGKILEEDKLDPMVVVGGRVPLWDANLRLPKIKRQRRSDLPAQEGPTFFVAEACEYRRHFLKLTPKAVVLTNIEAEHLDYFKDLEDIKSAFIEYVGKIPNDGFLVYNADDKNCVDVARFASARKVSCSFLGGAIAQAKNIRYERGKQVFEAVWKGREIGTFRIGVPGRFNVMNALEAVAAALTLGASVESAQKSLGKFSGTWRRFEKVGKVGKIIIISDYAHHPAGVSATIKAAKELYPEKKLLVVFQPHQKDRTKKLLLEFAEALSEAPNLVLSEIYEVAGREENGHAVSVKDLEREIKKISDVSVACGGDITETEMIVRKMMPEYDAVIFMGAGDIYKVADNLIK